MTKTVTEIAASANSSFLLCHSALASATIQMVKWKLKNCLSSSVANVFSASNSLMKQNHLSYRWNPCSVFKKKISSSLLSLTFCISEVISALLQVNSLWPMVVGTYSSFIQILGHSNFSPKSAVLSILRPSLNLINCR